MFAERELRRKFRSKGGEETGGGRKLHNEEIYILLAASDHTVISAMKSMRMKWEEHEFAWGDKNCIGNLIRELKSNKKRRHRHKWLILTRNREVGCRIVY
jgi:hypothetical protein